MYSPIELREKHAVLLAQESLSGSPQWQMMSCRKASRCQKLLTLCEIVGGEIRRLVEAHSALQGQIPIIVRDRAKQASPQPRAALSSGW